MATLIELKHQFCINGLNPWIDGSITTKYFLWACGMVNSDNIALVAALEGF